MYFTGFNIFKEFGSTGDKLLEYCVLSIFLIIDMILSNLKYQILKKYLKYKVFDQNYQEFNSGYFTNYIHIKPTLTRNMEE